MVRIELTFIRKYIILHPIALSFDLMFIDHMTYINSSAKYQTTHRLGKPTSIILYNHLLCQFMYPIHCPSLSLSYSDLNV